MIEAEEKITKTSVFVLCYTKLTPGMVITHDNSFLSTFSVSSPEARGEMEFIILQTLLLKKALSFGRVTADKSIILAFQKK